MAADTNFDDYDQQIARLQKKQAWEPLADYCRQVEKRLSKLMQSGQATEAHKRLRVQALWDLQIAYLVLDMPDQQLKAAREAHRAAQQVPLDALDMHFSYLALARAYRQTGQIEQARNMLTRAMTCLLSKRQAEFVRCSLLERASLEREAGNEEAEGVLQDLAERIKQARRWAYTQQDTLRSPA